MNESEEWKPDVRPEIDPRTTRLFYLVSAIVSLALLAVLVFLWYRAYTSPDFSYPGETLITNRDELTRFLDKNVPTPPDGDGPYYVPTGIVVQSLEFKGPYSVQAAGYIWQRYADTLPKDLEKGVVFPEADTTTFTKVYETHQANETLIGWNFKTTLREQFNYAKYPLDWQELWMRLWSVDFERNVYLTPDLEGDTTLKPEALSGVDPGLVLENWRLDRSYFAYRLNQYSANFGIRDYASDTPQPELYFNVSLRRYILSSLVSRGIVPLVILIQLFVIVMVIGSNSQRLEQFGVRPGAVIFTCAAFFFAVLLAQNALRDEIKWFGVVYLETLHVLTYFVILIVAVDSVLVVAFPRMRLFRQDNLWVEVLYWPIILGVLLVITLWFFRS